MSWAPAGSTSRECADMYIIRVSRAKLQQLLHHLRSGHLRHPHVGQNQVDRRGVVLNNRQRLLPRLRGNDRISANASILAIITRTPASSSTTRIVALPGVGTSEPGGLGGRRGGTSVMGRSESAGKRVTDSSGLPGEGQGIHELAGVSVDGWGTGPWSWRRHPWRWRNCESRPTPPACLARSRSSKTPPTRGSSTSSSRPALSG